MTARPTWSIFCDRCGNWTGQEVGRGGARKARATGRRRGWTRRDGEDFCPVHSAPVATS